MLVDAGLVAGGLRNATASPIPISTNAMTNVEMSAMTQTGNGLAAGVVLDAVLDDFADDDIPCFMKDVPR